ncbi:hypothetical protein L9F63_010521 [Diploptera punctata]|uniref:Protein sleepless n=1 Tax=Diploptera punctata TaxID=6984 RepID=A0AAD8AH07_DIPPU|nr:hypothetical protein L9F63_010521 [Diploptera punctata]
MDRRSFIFILLGTQYFTVCLAIKCYQCRTDRNKDCAQNSTTNKFLKECPLRPGFPGPPFCRTILQKLKFTGSDREVVIRECGYKKGHRSCYKTKFVDNSIQTICDCDTEGCNIGSNLSSSSLLWWLITIFVVIFRIRNPCS